MGNHLAIAAVTASFQRILQESLQEDVYGVRVTTLKPNALDGGTTETGVNIYLYLVTPNQAYRSPEPMSRRPQGEMVKRSQMAYDLQFLLSFYGNENELEPQRLYGSTARLMQDGFTLTPDMIRDTLADPTLSYLAESDLPNQLEPIRLVPTEISVENLSKIWSVFFQTPYSLSCTYKATVIFIEGTEPGERALPVRDRRAVVLPFQTIIIEQIIAQGGLRKPILSTSTIVISGQRLYHPEARVRIAGIDVIPQSVTDTSVVLNLDSIPDDRLRAGAQSLQVVHPNSSSLDRTAESNLAAFVLRPTIESLTLGSIDHRSSGQCDTEITVQFDVIVGASQLVVLVLNEFSSQRSTSYVFKAKARSQESHEITIALEGVMPGEYLVRAQIDGAESLLSYDTDRNSPTFNWYNAPKISIV
ncbi:hypothetical protein LEP3755_12130 [Leptolyngbya sp. NIES-3755]|nr:hypothetical protein LEP3755_12130 [Leptolyngbya sp. NIES-3755]